VFIVGHFGRRSRREIFPIRGEDKENNRTIKRMSYGKHKKDCVYDRSGIMGSLPAGTYGSTQHLTRIIQLGNIDKDKRERDNPQTGRVYDPKGIAPCLNCMQGGNLEPKILQGLNTNEDNNSYCIDSNYYKGISPSNINSGRRTHVIANTVPSGHSAGNVYDPYGLAPTVRENHGKITKTVNNMRIRKLTPKECWRLQGFPDSAFEKAEQVNSNTQLYKQAGNSVTTTVVKAIGKRLQIDNKEAKK